MGGQSVTCLEIWPRYAPATLPTLGDTPQPLSPLGCGKVDVEAGGGTPQGCARVGQALRAGGHVGKRFGVLGGDLNPRPSLFLASVLSFVPCASLIGLELVCICREGTLKKGRGARGAPQGEGLSRSVCFPSPLSLSQVHLSVSFLCPASPVCPSVCLWGGKG